MAEVISIGLTELYNTFLLSLPIWARNFINLFLIALMIFLYAIAIWKFYRFIAKKNIFELNLKKYNTASHPVVEKLLAGIFYFVEYLLIMPIIVFIWYAVFTLFFLLLTENIELNKLLIISATIIAAIRFAAYYKEDLAKDLAKLLPFTILGVALTTQFSTFGFQKVIAQLAGIPTLLNHIVIYLLFILVVEFMLRVFEVFFIFTGITTKEEIKTIEEG